MRCVSTATPNVLTDIRYIAARAGDQRAYDAGGSEKYTGLM